MASSPRWSEVRLGTWGVGLEDRHSRVGMSRDHRKLRAFVLSDDLALVVYKATQQFPKHEMFGLVSQLRRAAVSVPTNIVEGCARRSQGEYVQFLNMAFGSLRETGYLLSVAARLSYLDAEAAGALLAQYDEAARVLHALIHSLDTHA